MRPPRLHLTPLDPRYPTRLRSLARPPSSLTIQGGSLEASRAVAIVGSRAATRDAETFARELAAALAHQGVVVVSGGALGIDAAAHRGALRAGGRTWAVAGTGCEHCFPPEHSDLFDEIGASAGAMIWPFAPSSAARPGAFLLRNQLLVALADAVVVAQAGLPSGALRAAECARKMCKPLWVVPASPWAPGFAGSLRLLDEGARPLTSIGAFVPLHGPVSTGGPLHTRRSEPNDMDPSSSEVLRVISSAPLHLDEIALRAHLTVQATAAALLTLALEAVVVEGPPGFFRKPDGA